MAIKFNPFTSNLDFTGGSGGGLTAEQIVALTQAVISDQMVSEESETGERVYGWDQVNGVYVDLGWRATYDGQSEPIFENLVDISEFQGLGGVGELRVALGEVDGGDAEAVFSQDQLLDGGGAVADFDDRGLGLIQSIILKTIEEHGITGIQIVPTGGLAGQVLVKASDDDFDVEWVTLP